VTLADDGPAVNGQVELGPVIAANPPPPGTKFDTSTSWLRAVRIEPKPEPPRGVDRADWNAQVQSVLEGTAKEDLTLPATFAVLKPDGSFRFDALAPGRYMLLVDIHGLRPLQTCGWGILLATGRTEFTVADKAITLSPLELKATLHPQVGSSTPKVGSLPRISHQRLWTRSWLIGSADNESRRGRSRQAGSTLRRVRESHECWRQREP
jgi:hypothetical protein